MHISKGTSRPTGHAITKNVPISSCSGGWLVPLHNVEAHNVHRRSCIFPSVELIFEFILQTNSSGQSCPETETSPSTLGNYSTAGIATDAKPCAKVGMYVRLSRNWIGGVDFAPSSISSTGMSSGREVRQSMGPSPPSFATACTVPRAWG